MRFLQTEWHRHERDRNSWEIERADMKARIAKMEGDNRAAKMMQQAYLTRVKMLEAALKHEREKNKAVTAASSSQQGEGLPAKDEKYGGCKVYATPGWTVADVAKSSTASLTDRSSTRPCNLKQVEQRAGYILKSVSRRSHTSLPRHPTRPLSRRQSKSSVHRKNYPPTISRHRTLSGYNRKRNRNLRLDRRS